MTVAETRERVSDDEFEDWIAYCQLEPFGPLREDRRAGEIVRVLAEVNRDRKKQPAPFALSDFFPELDPEYRPASVSRVRDPQQVWDAIMIGLGSRRQLGKE